LRFSTVGLHFCDFGFRIAVFLFSLEQSSVSLGTLQSFFGLLNLTGRGCPLLLQAAKRVKVALGIVARAAGFNQLSIECEDFFAGTAGREVSLIGLGGLHLGLRAGRLAAQVGVIELQKQLAFADVVSFFHQQTLHSSCDRGVSFEILHGFHFAIGGNQAADGSAFHGCGANLQRR
jgi:hypothetical protein